jgi:hypothetical protein
MNKSNHEPESSSSILAAVQRILAPEPAADVLDHLAEESATLAGFGAATLTFTLSQHTWLGTFNLPESRTLALKSQLLVESHAERALNHSRIREAAIDGTHIAYVATDERGHNGQEIVPSAWHPEDRVYVFADGSKTRGSGLLTLMDPHDGRALDPQRLDSLRRAERFLGVTALYAETRIHLRRMEESLGQVQGVLDNLASGTLSMESVDWPGEAAEFRTGTWQFGRLRRGQPRFDTLDDAQRKHILAVLVSTDWVIQGPRGAARVLDVDPSTLRSRMRRLGLRRPQPGVGVTRS